MSKKTIGTPAMGAAALALGVGILLTQVLSFRALVVLEAVALVASGVLYFICPRR